MLTVTVEKNDFAMLADRMVQRVGDAVIAAVNAIQALAQTIVAVDTGNLKNSIHVEQKSRFIAYVLTMVMYAHFVEFGTVKMAAQPYMRPAVERVRPIFIRAMTQALAA